MNVSADENATSPVKGRKTKRELIDEKIAQLHSVKELAYKPAKNYFKAFDEGYDPPPAEILREMLDEDSLSHSEFGDIVGVDARTVRRWTQISNDPGSVKGIPYSAWRLFLIVTGRVPAI